MSPEIISIRGLNDLTEVVSKSVDALRRGQIAVFPTETVYGLATLASNSDAVKRLCVEKGRRAGHALPVAISGEGALLRYVPNASSKALRLARKFWPGPLTLVLDATSPNSELQNLPESSLKAIMPGTTVGFRAPQNDFLQQVLQAVDEPLVLTSANLTGEAPATSALEARDALGARPDLIIDDGEAVIGQPSTVLKVEDQTLTILRKGALSQEKISQGAAKVIVFVCTGNTCRSPMAEVLCKRRLAESLKVSADMLADRGYVVLSAGVAANDYSPASDKAQQVIKEFNLSLGDHAAHTFDHRLAKIADQVFTMSKSHASTLSRLYPEIHNRIVLLSKNGDDVSDPFGSSETVYRTCAKQIDEQIRLRLPEILE